jgi:hypothetical protein
VTYYYENSYSFGRLTINATHVLLKAGDATKVYDGSALTCESYELLEGMLAEGHVIAKCEFSGMQTEIGRSENLILSVTIRDAEGKDVTSNYAIELQAGKLVVTMR